VFAVLCANAVLLSRSGVRGASRSPEPRPASRALARTALVALVATCARWCSAPGTATACVPSVAGGDLRLLLHGLGALLVIASLATLFAAPPPCAAGVAPPRPRARSRACRSCLLVQIVLGGSLGGLPAARDRAGRVGLSIAMCSAARCSSRTSA
jgi:hypothetical protein